MKYLLTLYGDESQDADATPEEWQATLDAYWDYDRALRAAGAFIAGEALQPSPTATTVRVRDGERALTDGPFAETREQLGGFYLLECRDLDEALDWASKCPAALNGTIEVRAIMEFDTPADIAEAERASAGS